MQIYNNKINKEINQDKNMIVFNQKLKKKYKLINI